MSKTELTIEHVKLSSLEEGDRFRCDGVFYEHTGKTKEVPFLSDPVVCARRMDTGAVDELASFFDVEIYSDAAP